MMRRLFLVSGIAVATLLASGCARSTDSGSATPASNSSSDMTSAPSSAQTVSGSFSAVSLVGHELVPGSTITIDFTDGHISVHAGCNGMQGQFTVESGQLKVGDLASTRMACEQPLMDQDTWVAAFLAASPTVELDGETLRLTGRGVVAEAMELQFYSPQPMVPIADVIWALDTIVRGGAAASVPAGVTPTITITGGQLRIDAQCNSVSGTVVIGNGTLTITDVLGTMMFCDGAPGEMEKLLTDVLTGTVPYTVDGDRLIITGADGTQLEFVRGAALATSPPASTDGDNVSSGGIGTSAPAADGDMSDSEPTAGGYPDPPTG